MKGLMRELDPGDSGLLSSYDHGDWAMMFILSYFAILEKDRSGVIKWRVRKKLEKIKRPGGINCGISCGTYFNSALRASSLLRNLERRRILPTNDYLFIDYVLQVKIKIRNLFVMTPNKKDRSKTKGVCWRM